MYTFLDYFFMKEGYQKIPSNLSEFTLFVKTEQNYTNVIHLIGYDFSRYLDGEQFQILKDKIKNLFLSKGAADIHILSLFLTSDIQKAEQVCGADRFCWFLDVENRKLNVPETRVEDFYGMRNRLQEATTKKEILEEEILRLKASAAAAAAENQKRIKEEWLQFPYISITLTVLNVLFFLLCTFTGEMLYNIGALYSNAVIEERAFYRFITSMFLHGDINHLISNMTVLVFLGQFVEKKTGHIYYMFLYLVSGIGAGIFSVGYDYLSEGTRGSVGASGAIFGLIGAVLFFVICYKGRWQTFTFGRLLFLIFYSVYSGITSSNTDNAAHIGGLVTGFVITAMTYFLFCRQKNLWENRI